MKSILVWDLPLRLLHWALAGSVSAALCFALAVDDDSPLFRLHMVFGLVAVFLVVVRVVWGVIGTRHARFAQFPLRPAALLAYVRTLLTLGVTRFAGHNPGAAWASLAMFALVGALAFTGLVAGGEAFEELHEVCAYALLAVIGLHLAGLAWHTLRHRENISLAMVTGRKLGDPAEAIPSSRPGWALALLVGCGAWIGALFASHDAQAGTVRLPVLGTVVPLGEREGGERAGGGRESDDHESAHREKRGGQRGGHDD